MPSSEWAEAPGLSLMLKSLTRPVTPEVRVRVPSLPRKIPANWDVMLPNLARRRRLPSHPAHIPHWNRHRKPAVADSRNPDYRSTGRSFSGRTPAFIPLVSSGKTRQGDLPSLGPRLGPIGMSAAHSGFRLLRVPPHPPQLRRRCVSTCPHGDVRRCAIASAIRPWSRSEPRNRRPRPASAERPRPPRCRRPHRRTRGGDVRAPCAS